MKQIAYLIICVALTVVSALCHPVHASQDGGYDLTSTLWAKAVLEVPDFPVVLKWKMVGSDITENGDQVISGYFYADPADFAYGNTFNPELFVKIYIDINGWCNIAFNHVTVDPVTIYSEHRPLDAAAVSKAGSATLTGRLVEHQYDGVTIDTTLTVPDDGSDPCDLYSADLWAEAHMQISETVSSKLIWRTVGKAVTPSGDQVISGYFYALPEEVNDGSFQNPEMFVKIYIARNGWANIAFNHVTIYDIGISSAHHYSGQADQTGTISLTRRLLEHQYDGVFAASGQNACDITVSVQGNGTVMPSLFGGAEAPSGCVVSVPHGGAQSYVIDPGTNYYVKHVEVDGASAADGPCLYHYTLRDVAGPTDLKVVFGKCIIGGNPLDGLNAADVYVSGGYAYVANNDAGFSIVDVDDPANPAIKGWVDTPGEATGVTVSGGYAYVADGYAGLSVIDITDPENPAVAGTADLPGRTTDIFISGEKAYAKNDALGLTVLDITDPAHPAVTGWIAAPENMADVYVSGSYACYTGDGTFRIVDVTDPSRPTAVGQVDVGAAQKVAVSGTHAYVASYYGENPLKILNIADPENPAIIGSAAIDCYTFIVDLSVFGDYAYIVYGYGYRIGTPATQIFDIADPTAPTAVGSIGNSFRGRVYASGHYAYLADGALSIMDVADPSNPTITGRIGRLGAADIDVSGNHAFVAQGDNGLLVLDITDPVRPVTVGRADTGGDADFLQVSGNYAYVVNRDQGLALIDVTDPAHPVLTGRADVFGAREVTVSEPYAYLGTGAEGVRILDIGDPTNPTIIATVDTPTEAWDVAVSGNYAYIGDWYTGLQVADISDPANPTIVWSRNHTGVMVRDLAVSDDYLYTTTADGLEVWDIGNPENPAILRVDEDLADFNRIQFSGAYPYMATSYSFCLCDTTVPAHPTVTGCVTKYDNSLGIKLITAASVSGHYAYICDKYDGLSVVDLDSLKKCP